MRNLTPAELAAWLTDPARPDPLLLDVREPWEFQTCHIAGARHVPINELPARLNELDPDAEMVAICHHGVRSLHVVHFLARQGFERVHNLAGGVDAWARAIDPGMPVY
ncbi:MAG TPA: rhodanese-like domain-containing protein [Burkholderiales bacterium]|nr:rhodanese-like domain-containing protein [Burkholderiales bacterium]